MEDQLKVVPQPDEGLKQGAIRTPWQIFWGRLKRRKTAMLGAWTLLILYLTALFAGFVAPYHFSTQDRSSFFHPPTQIVFAGGGLAVRQYDAKPGGMYEPTARTTPLKFLVRGEKYKLFGLIPSTLHLFGTASREAPVYLLGTDQYGRDVLSRVIYGSQISLSIGVIGILLSFSVGMIMGGISGYFGGWTDTAIMRVVEVIMSVPALYLIIALRNTFPPGLSSTQIYVLIVVILSFISWASMARVIRGMALSLRERQFVLAAKVLGASHWRAIRKHVLPNTMSYVIVAATLSIPYYILGEVVLSFLAVGIQEPDASWGLMLNAAQNTEYLQRYPWLLAPGVAIFITVLAFNFLGDGLRDAADAKSM